MPLQGPQAGTARARARLLPVLGWQRQPGPAPGGTAASSEGAGEQRGHAEPQEQGEPRAELPEGAAFAGPRPQPS